MKSIIKVFAVIILCAAVAGAAEKGKKKKIVEKTTTEDPAKKDFKQSDMNRDGFVNLAEWKTASKNDGTKSDALFKAKDKNNDGKLTSEEFKAEVAAAAGEKPKFTKQQVDRRLKELKDLLDKGLIKQDFYDRKVKECETQ